MIMRNGLRVLAMSAAVHLSLPAAAFSGPPALTAAELMQAPSLKRYATALENGEIVLLTQPEREEANQLTVLMLVLVPARLQKTMETLQRQAMAADAAGALAAGEIGDSTPAGLDKVLASVAFAADERSEVEKLLAVDAGDSFNFSTEEIALISARAKALTDAQKEGDAALEAMSGAMREVLKGRCLAYLKGGMDGLAPYRFGPSKQVDPSGELIAATEGLRLVRERFPDYYDCLRHYPEKMPPKLAHRYFWAKQTEADRPLFVLKHWILDVQPDYALITERRFYLSHSLSSL